jgi:hypothetical protein
MGTCMFAHCAGAWHRTNNRHVLTALTIYTLFTGNKVSFDKRSHHEPHYISYIPSNGNRKDNVVYFQRLLHGVRSTWQHNGCYCVKPASKQSWDALDDHLKKLSCLWYTDNYYRTAIVCLFVFLYSGHKTCSNTASVSLGLSSSFVTSSSYRISRPFSCDM